MSVLKRKRSRSSFLYSSFYAKAHALYISEKNDKNMGKKQQDKGKLENETGFILKKFPT
jgi:hypothetical protein